MHCLPLTSYSEAALSTDPFLGGNGSSVSKGQPRMVVARTGTRIGGKVPFRKGRPASADNSRNRRHQTVRFIVCDVAQPIRYGHGRAVIQEGQADRQSAECGRYQYSERVETTRSKNLTSSDINMSAFLVAQEVVALIAQRRGTINVIAELSARSRPFNLMPWARRVSAMTRGMAMEWGEHSIRVNAIAQDSS